MIWVNHERLGHSGKKRPTKLLFGVRLYHLVMDHPPKSQNRPFQNCVSDFLSILQVSTYRMATKPDLKAPSEGTWDATNQD